MRLIDADVLAKEINEMPCYCTTDIQHVLYKIIDTPTFDLDKAVGQIMWERDMAIEQLNSYGVQFGEEAELQRVRCGKWIAQDETYTRFRCSACGSENHSHRWEYCCKCGAKMDGE